MTDMWWEKESLIKFQSPTSIFIVGPSNSGKSVLVQHILENASGMFLKPPTKILFCYGVWQKIYNEMEAKISNIQFHKGFPNTEEMENWSATEEHKLLVLDDLMVDLADSGDIVHMLCVGSHHHNITVIHILQNLFQKGKAMRTASLNCHYFILFRNYRDQLQVQTFGKQVFPGLLKYFMSAYMSATAARYGYLVVDLNPHTDKTYQLRTLILPGQSTIVYESLK